jgi:hypothetical protein
MEAAKGAIKVPVVSGEKTRASVFDQTTKNTSMTSFGQCHMGSQLPAKRANPLLTKTMM